MEITYYHPRFIPDHLKTSLEDKEDTFSKSVKSVKQTTDLLRKKLVRVVSDNQSF